MFELCNFSSSKASGSPQIARRANSLLHCITINSKLSLKYGKYLDYYESINLPPFIPFRLLENRAISNYSRGVRPPSSSAISKTYPLIPIEFEAFLPFAVCALWKLFVNRKILFWNILKINKRSKSEKNCYGKIWHSSKRPSFRMCCK